MTVEEKAKQSSHIAFPSLSNEENEAADSRALMKQTVTADDGMYRDSLMTRWISCSHQRLFHTEISLPWHILSVDDEHSSKSPFSKNSTVLFDCATR